VKRRSIDAPAVQAPRALLRRALALGLQDLSSGRAELHAAVAGFVAAADARGELLACSALALFAALADNDYTGFQAAVARVAAAPVAADHDAADALLATAGALVAGSFNQLDAPELAALAATIEAALADTTLAAPLRCCAGMAALGYHHIGMNLERVLWLELAMRPLLADTSVSEALADEAWHLFVQSLYQCEAPDRAQALRQQRFASGRSLSPGIGLKLALLDAQMALGAGQAEIGRAALVLAEPWLDPRAPRSAGWWHLLRSRLALLEQRPRLALTHARLALRLSTQSRLPERWMGVTVMQEGQVQMASGDWVAAVPFFERAGHAASGAQARYCWCLAHLARALQAFNTAAVEAGRGELAQGLMMARELAWLNFFRAVPEVAATVCALAIEHGIETDFVREVVAARSLHAVRPDLAGWPWPIRVRTLGGLRIEIDGRLLAFKGKVAKKPLELLLFIVASGGSGVSAATAMFALWRELEGDKAHAAFNVALHRLRQLLGSGEAVQLEHGRLSLNPQRMWVDCLAFEQLVDGVGLPAPDRLPASARTAAERALALYAGAFLHDIEDEAWQLVCRTRLASKFTRMVVLLARAALGRGDGPAARAVLARGLEVDPLAEDLRQLRVAIAG